MENSFYPKQHEALLRKANLLGHGYMEVYGIHNNKEVSTSEDGVTFETKKIPVIDGVISQGSHLVRNFAGQIAGYWANGLTAEEVRIINEECGVPKFYLGEPTNQLTGKPMHLDTYIKVSEGQRYNLENPVDMAYVLVILELPELVGPNRKKAIDEGALLYFHSVEEERQEKQQSLNLRKEVSKLIHELTISRKQQLIKIMSFMGRIGAEPSISVENAVMLFDELCFTLPEVVREANNIVNPNEYVIIYSLIRSGHIEAADDDGPYYKNPQVYGQRVLIGDNMADMIKRIHGYPELIKAYNELKAHEEHREDPAYIPPVDADVLNLLARHGIGNENSDESREKELREKITRNNKATMLKLFNDSGIEHSFNDESDLKEIKDFYVERMLERSNV